METAGSVAGSGVSAPGGPWTAQAPACAQARNWLKIDEYIKPKAILSTPRLTKQTGAPMVPAPVGLGHIGSRFYSCSEILEILLALVGKDI